MIVQTSHYPTVVFNFKVQERGISDTALLSVLPVSLHFWHQVRQLVHIHLGGGRELCMTHQHDESGHTCSSAAL